VAPAHHRVSETTDDVIARRVAFLTAYQDAAYAARFEKLVRSALAAEDAVVGGDRRLTDAVARTLFHLMAYKDEYEVARLQTDPSFLDGLRDRFDGPVRLAFHLAPPLFSKRDPISGELAKRRFGGWIVPVLRVLARLKRLRGTPFDPFGLTAERRTERRLIVDYVAQIETQILPALSPANHDAAVALAEGWRTIKGFGHVKARNLAIAEEARVRLMADFLEAVD
jgi:indolepyruvate ferredoxin oxidoreductase